MSQLTASPCPITRPIRSTASARPRLLLVETRDTTEHYGVGFVLLCIVLLVGGLLSLLLLNTNRAQQSFALDKLQAQSGSLTDIQEELGAEMDSLTAPQQLALRAQAIGLTPATQVKYIRKADGKVLGVAKKSGTISPFRVGTLPSTSATRAANTVTSVAELDVIMTKPQQKAVDPKKAHKISTAKPASSAITTPNASLNARSTVDYKVTTTSHSTAASQIPKPATTR